MQRALMQYFMPQNQDMVRAALIECGRQDLVGNSPRALVKPAAGHSKSIRGKGKKKAIKGQKGPQNEKGRK